jgi:hypothetical protein
MKNVAIVLALAVAGLTGCEKSSTQKSVDNSVIEGTWKITLYEDDGDNETSDYSDLSFTFKDDGTVTAQPSLLTVIYSGTWSTNKDSDHVDFNLFFSQYEDLSDDWEVVNSSDTKLELKDVSGGDGSIDYLTFEKK